MADFPLLELGLTEADASTHLAIVSLVARPLHQQVIELPAAANMGWVNKPGFRLARSGRSDRAPTEQAVPSTISHLGCGNSRGMSQ